MPQSFRQFLAESKMTPAEAMRILGLEPGFTETDLKSAYRAAARKHHSDLSRGSDEQMKLVNIANDVLERTAGQQTRHNDHKTWRADWEARAMAFAAICREKLEETFKPDLFTKHFEAVFGEPFTLTKDDFPEYTERNASTSSTGMTRDVEYSNASKSIVLGMQLWISFDALMNRKPSLASPDAFLSQSIYTFILYNRRSVKLTQSRFTYSQAKDTLTDPEALFPKAKLLAQTKKSGARAMTKRDVLLTFQKELSASLSGEWVYVPVGNFVVALWRMTMGKGYASWGINGVYKAKGSGRVAQPHGFVSFLETEKTINFLVDKFHDLRKQDDLTAQQIADACTKWNDQYKEIRDLLM